jgi:hypothetical protein
MSWPTTYYAIWVPLKKVWVVTAPDDTGEMQGFLDVALGWCSRGANSQTDTRFSLKHAGHWTNLGSSSSNHDRPHSQRILYRRCAMTEPSSPS